MAVILPPRLRMTAAERCRIRLEPERHAALHPDLDVWRSNVGGPVATDAAPAAPARLAGIDVLCWNVAIGLGELGRVIDRLRAGAFGGAGEAADRPLVVLVQEAYRSGGGVPVAAGSAHHGGKHPAGERTDIVALADRCGLSLRYSPSMRNGAHRSDRGNAILSTARLAGAHATLLPYVRQRRVVVSAHLAGHEQLTFVSAHLDTHGRLGRRPDGRLVGGRLAQAHALGRITAALDGDVVLGADLNSLLGLADPAVRALVRAGLEPGTRLGTWRHTFHPFRLLLDHVLFRTDGRIAAVHVARLDERPADSSAAVFGSDHHPLLARIELAGG